MKLLLSILVLQHNRGYSRENGAKVFYRKFDGFRSQKQFAVEQSTNAWVICMDADEVVSDHLMTDILTVQSRKFMDCSGFSFPRCDFYHGKFLRHGNFYRHINKSVYSFHKELLLFDMQIDKQ